MKIAVCISGGVRYPHLGLQSIRKIFPNDFVKVFIHTWKIKNKDSFLNTISGLEYKEADKTVETDLSFLENYNYEKLLVENYDECEKKFNNLFSSLKFAPATDENDRIRTDVGPISMHYSIYQSNELKKQYEKEHNIVFDWVIRMRTDSDFRYDLHLDAFTEELNIPSGEDWAPDSINDQFAIGTSPTMDLYSSLYENIHHTQSSKYYPETIFCSHLKNMNLVPSRINFPVRINNGIDFRKVWYPHLVE